MLLKPARRLRQEAREHQGDKHEQDSRSQEYHDEDGKAVKLINRLRNPKENANSLQKFWSWVKDTSLKASDELATGKAKNLRTVCQLGNIAFSLISLGVFIPLYTRTTTNKKREAELAAAAAENAKAAQGFTRELIKNDSPAFQSFFQT